MLHRTNGDATAQATVVRAVSSILDDVSTFESWRRLTSAFGMADHP
jgi:hypothetical protein